MRKSARDEYLNRYTEQRNYGILMDIYQRAIAGAGDRGKR